MTKAEYLELYRKCKNVILSQERIDAERKIREEALKLARWIDQAHKKENCDLVSEGGTWALDAFDEHYLHMTHVDPDGCETGKTIETKYFDGANRKQFERGLKIQHADRIEAKISDTMTRITILSAHIDSLSKKLRECLSRPEEPEQDQPAEEPKDEKPKPGPYGEDFHVAERETVADCNRLGDNTAALRGALKAMFEFWNVHGHAYSVRVAPVRDSEEEVESNRVAIMERAQAALLAPPRNCDVGTIDEQQRRFGELCSRYPDCSGCAVKGLKKRGDNCELIWAQMRYAAQ